nr:type II toxin-antitoxin system HigB family toxin [Natronospira proteinivora]
MREFWEKHPDAAEPLKAWHSEVEHAAWKTPQDIKNRYGSASFVGNNRVVFNIGGNKYRLVVRVRYDLGIVFVRFIGTHAEYDRINVETV